MKITDFETALRGERKRLVGYINGIDALVLRAITERADFHTLSSLKELRRTAENNLFALDLLIGELKND
jgi:hypothetical protein